MEQYGSQAVHSTSYDVSHSRELSEFGSPDAQQSLPNPNQESSALQIAMVGVNIYGRSSNSQTQQPATNYVPAFLHCPTCPEALLTKGLVYDLEGAGLNGGWIGFIPAYIGHDRGVDAAASCFKTALQGAVKQSSPKAIEANCARDYARATRALQLKLRNKEHRSSDSALLIASILASIDWGFMHPEGSAAVSAHTQGINAIMLAFDPVRIPSELRRSMLLSSWPGSFLVPVARGIASPYESQHWLLYDTRFSGDSEDMARLSRLYTHMFIRLPRVIALVRRLRLQYLDPKTKWRAIRAALVCAELRDHEAESCLLHRVGVRPTSNPDTKRITPTSLYFDRVMSFQMAIYYWSTRILTNRLCLKLLELVELPEGLLDSAELVAENIRMATNILMSWEFATIGAGFGMWPLRLGFIALWSVTPYMKSVRKCLKVSTLREWIVQSYNALHRQEDRYSEADMDEAADLLVGGPLKGFLVEFGLGVRSFSGNYTDTKG